MGKNKISFTCDRCGGTGFESGPDEEGDPIQSPCPKCSGEGNLTLGYLAEDLVENIETIKDKVDWLKKNVKEILKHLDVDEV